MAEDQTAPAGADVVAVLRLCEDILALNERRLQLDEELTRHPQGDREREERWVELDQVNCAIPPLLAQLASIPSASPAGTRAKAAVLGLMLRGNPAGAGELTPETAALALSLADEVASLS